MVQPTEPLEIPNDVKIDLRTITEYSTKNNAIGYQNRIQLQQLQSWIRQQMELYKSDQ